jgi:hypothetical protein
MNLAMSDKSHAQLMAGRYEGSRREETTFASFVALLSQATVSVDDQGHLVTPITKVGGEPKKFEEISPFLWREVGGQGLLAAKVKDGKIVMWADGDDATGVYTPAPAWRRSSWLLPALLCSLIVLFATALRWPITALVRRHYRAKPREGLAGMAYRWTHLAATAQCLVIGVWLTLILGMMATFYITWMPYFISSAMDKWILLAHALSVVLLPLAALVALWNIAATFRTRSGWRSAFARLWSLVFAASSLTILYTAVIFHFIGFGVMF